MTGPQCVRRRLRTKTSKPHFQRNGRTRISVHGVRLWVKLGKQDALKRELEDLWLEKTWSARAWERAASTKSQRLSGFRYGGGRHQKAAKTSPPAAEPPGQPLVIVPPSRQPSAIGPPAPPDPLGQPSATGPLARVTASGTCPPVLHVRRSFPEIDCWNLQRIGGGGCTESYSER